MVLYIIRYFQANNEDSRRLDNKHTKVSEYNVSLQVALAKLEDDKQRVEKELQKTKNEADKLIKAIKDMEDELRIRNDDKQRVEKELQKVKDANQSLNIDILKIINDDKRIKIETDKIKDESQRLKIELQKVKQDNTRLLKIIDESESKSSIRTDKELNKSSNKEINTGEDLSNKLWEHNIKLREEIIKLKRENRELKNSDNIQNDSLIELNEAKNKVDALLKTIKDMEDEICIRSKDNLELTDKNKELLKTIKDMEDELRIRNDDNSRLMRENSSLIRENSRLLNNVNSTKLKIRDIELDTKVNTSTLVRQSITSENEGDESKKIAKLRDTIASYKRNHKQLIRRVSYLERMLDQHGIEDIEYANTYDDYFYHKLFF